MKKFSIFSTLSVFSIQIACSLHGAQFNVTTAADAGAGSLRQAIVDLTGSTDPNNTITINIPGATPIQLASDLPPIEKNATISATGANQTIDGGAAYRLIVGAKKAEISIKNCTLKGGLAKGGTGSNGYRGSGGNSTAGGGGGGGGMGAGGGIYIGYQQTLTLEDMTLSNNQAEGGQGGASLSSTTYVYGGGGGGSSFSKASQNGSQYNGGGDVPGKNSIALPAGGAADSLGGTVGYGGGKGGSSSVTGSGSGNGGGNGAGTDGGPALAGQAGGYCGGGGGTGNLSGDITRDGSGGGGGGNGGGNGGGDTYDCGGGSGGGIGSGGAGGISPGYYCAGGGGGGFGGGGGGGGGGSDRGLGAGSGGGGGGFGAGGGGGSSVSSPGGKGGVFGGDGSAGATGTADLGGGGGGGAGLGGAIFVGDEASLRLGNNIALAGNRAVGGRGNGGGTGISAAGQGYAPDFFLFRGAELIFQGDADQTISFSIQSDQSAPAGHLDKGVTKKGSSTITLSSIDNNYRGGTQVLRGALRVSKDENLGHSSGSLLLKNSSTLTGMDSFNSVRPITLEAGGTIAADASANVTLSGVISGSGGLTKAGPGTIALKGNNTYRDGVKVSEGTLQISGDHHLGDPANQVTLTSGVLEAVESFTTTRTTTLTNSPQISVANSKTLTMEGVISGTGILTKSGDGTLCVTASNTYSGGTTILGGVVVVGAIGAIPPTSATLGNVRGAMLDLNNHDQVLTSLSGGGPDGGNVLLGTATLTVEDNTSQTFSGSITGTGSVIKQGTGEWTLNGINDFSSILIREGILAVSSHDNLGEAEVLLDGGILHATGSAAGRHVTVVGSSSGIKVDDGQTMIFSQGIEMDNPSMALSKAGGGTLDIQDADSFMGTLNIEDGTVSLTNAGSFDSNTHLYLNQAGNQTGTCVFDITQASGDRDIGSLNGTGYVYTGANHLRVLNEEDCYFDGEIEGTGGVSKLGGGIFTLTGHSRSFSGDSHVHEGHLQIEGTLPCPITVHEGASLGGNGFAGDMNNLGSVMPGASIGTLTVASFTQGAGGTLEVELNDLGQTDLLIVTGAATLNGLIEIVPDPGVYLPGTTYTVIQAGSVTGTFSNMVVRSSDDFRFGITYFPTSVVLQLLSGGGGGPILPISLLHGNAKRAGVFLEKCTSPGTDLTYVFENLQVLSFSELKTALSGLTPAQFGAFDVMNYNNSRSIIDLFSNQLAQKTTCKMDHPTISVWVQPLGSYVNQRVAEDNFGFHAWSLGTAVGATCLYNNFLVGWGLGFLHTELGWEERMGHGRQQNYYGGVYGAYTQDRWYVSGSLLGAGNDYETHRGIHFANINRTASSNHLGGEVSGRLQSGMYFSFKHDLRVQPYLIVDSYNSFEGGYGENGADSLNLTVKSHYSGMVRVNPAVEVVREISSKLGCVAPSVYLGYALEMPVTGGFLQSNLAGCCCNILEGRSFYKNRNQICGGASIKGTMKSGPALALHYEFNAGSRYFSNNADVSVEWSF